MVTAMVPDQPWTPTPTLRDHTRTADTAEVSDLLITYAGNRTVRIEPSHLQPASNSGMSVATCGNAEQAAASNQARNEGRAGMPAGPPVTTHSIPPGQEGQ